LIALLASTGVLVLLALAVSFPFRVLTVLNLRLLDAAHLCSLLLAIAILIDHEVRRRRSDITWIYTSKIENFRLTGKWTMLPCPLSAFEECVQQDSSTNEDGIYTSRRILHRRRLNLSAAIVNMIGVFFCV
jgi:hypothetical protein